MDSFTRTDRLETAQGNVCSEKLHPPLSKAGSRLCRIDPFMVFFIDWLLGGKYAVFNMLSGGFGANTDQPPYSFCIDLLLGSKYDGWPRNLDKTRGVFAQKILKNNSD